MPGSGGLCCLDGLHDAVGNLVDAADAVHLGEDAAFGILGDNGFGLLVVQVQAVADDGFVVVIRHRLDLYHEQTEAVVAKYAERGILTQVDGTGPINEVTDRVMQALKAAQAV